MGRFLATSDDVLALATAGDIILTDTTYGVRNTFVEAAAETGKYKQSAVKTIRPYTEFTNSYQLRSSNLVLPFGVAVATNYFIFGCSVTQVNTDYVRAVVNIRQYTTAAMFDAANSPDISVTVTGGFGVVDTTGWTLTGCPQSANYSVAGEETGTLHATSGDFCTGGVLLHRLKKTWSITTTGTVTTPLTNCNLTAPLDIQKDNTGELHISSVTGFIYLDPAA